MRTQRRKGKKEGERIEKESTRGKEKKRRILKEIEGGVLDEKESFIIKAKET